MIGSPNADRTRAVLQEDMGRIARTTTQFARLLPPVESIPTAGSNNAQRGEAQNLLVAHALAHSAMSTLHVVRASAGDQSSINSALVHATEVLKILEKVTGMPRVSGQKRNEGWDLVMDKGTYDAIALSEKEDESGRIYKKYPTRISEILKDGGFFLLYCGLIYKIYMLYAFN